MHKNRVKEKIKKGEPSIGVWCSLDHPGIAEILADAGFDWIVFDTEHGHFTITTLRSCMDSIRCTDVLPMVRVAANDPTIIKQTLELGAEGLVIPLVCSAQSAKAAVSSCKYPPEGTRGIGAGRCARYGSAFKENLEQANDNILIAIQIEHVNAVRNLDGIINIKGIDVMFIGPNDLAGSMGITGQIDHPDVQSAIRKVIDYGKNAGIAVGMWCNNEEHVVSMIEKGMCFVAYNSGASLLISAARQSIDTVRRLLKKSNQDSSINVGPKY